MRICKPHWDMCRAAIDVHGLSSLVSKSGEEAAERLVAEANGDKSAENFDPLMSMNNHFMGQALQCGGLYLMSQNESGENEGYYCPLCEFEKHNKDWNSQDKINETATAMAEYARDEGLIARVQ